MPLSVGQRAQFARVARARFNRHETAMQAALTAAISDWLDLARAAALPELRAAAPQQPPDGLIGKMLHSFTVADAAAVVARLRRLAPRFAAMLDRHVMPVYERMLDEVLHAGLTDTRTAADLTEWRGAWLAKRRQELVKIPDAITGQFRTALDDLARTEGTSVDDAARLAQTMLDKGYPSWTGRARLIARTETVGANNQGSLASWSSLAEASGQTATKSWLATNDDKTRPDHADADGATVDINDSFTVGGEDMNGPGDDNASAEQTANCRCTLTFDFPDGEPADIPEDLAAAAAVSAPSLPVNGDVPSGAAVMLMLDAASAGRLAVDGGEDPASMHVTLGYLREAPGDMDPAVAATILGGLLDGLAPLADGLPIEADPFALAEFNPESDEREPCQVVLVQSDALATIHDDVTATLGEQASTTFPTWIPHITQAYVGADDMPAWDAAAGLAEPVVFDRLILGWAGTDYTITNPPPDLPGQTDVLTAAREAPMTAPTTDTPPVDGIPAEATGGDTGTADLTPVGPTWSGPLAILDVASSDGRKIAAAGGTVRPLPLPLSMQKSYSHGSMDNNDEVVTVGRILAAEVRSDPTLGPILWGTGDYLDPMMNFDAQQAMATVEAGLGLVSVDLAVLAMTWETADGAVLDPQMPVPDGTSGVDVALEWELGGVTLVPFPAFADARISNDPVTEDVVTEEAVADGPVGVVGFAAASPEAPVLSEDGATITLSDGSTCGVGDTVGIPDYDDDGGPETGVITAIDAGTQVVTVTPTMEPDDEVQPPDMDFPVGDLVPAAAPQRPPGQELVAAVAVRPYTAAFFTRPEADGPTPFTVDIETGACYGHLAEYGTCHVGKLAETGACVTAPHSERDYADFHLTPVPTDQGPLDVGRVTVGTGHAAPGGGFANAVAHYDNTGAQVAVVRATDGEHGIWLCGQLVHDTPVARVEEVMRSPLSGDWRSRNGHLELCAALAVNVPGFPIRRPVPVIGQSKALGQLSLVAAGVVMRAAPVVLDEVGLPSGASIPTRDFEALVAASVAAITRGQAPAVASEVELLALRRARARLALVST